VAAKDEKVEVEILDVQELTTYPQPGKPFVTRIISYRGPDMISGTVFIPKDEDTPENRAKRIREDLDKKLGRKPEKITV